MDDELVFYSYKCAECGHAGSVHLAGHSLSQLRTLETQVVEKLNKRHFLGVSQAREKILHIARGAGVSVKELLAGRGPKEPKAEPWVAKFRYPDDSTKQ